ncbi:hypothetical protein BCAR13_1080002 [Paraburkholderia caribensis]|nr:hypothetical protein BCAR13_1080002 [Paraburkholderia caribensis]
MAGSKEPFKQYGVALREAPSGLVPCRLQVRQSDPLAGLFISVALVATRSWVGINLLNRAPVCRYVHAIHWPLPRRSRTR